MLNRIVSENDPKLVLEEGDFSPDVDSTVLIRERTRGSELQGTFKKKTAQPIGESDHTVTILPSRGCPVVISKRDIAIERKEAENPGPSKRQEVSEDEISSSEEERSKQVNSPNDVEVPEGSKTSSEVHMLLVPVIRRQKMSIQNMLIEKQDLNS